MIQNRDITSALANLTRTSTNLSDQRSVCSIAWSCLTTLFLCAWVSVHLDIPATRRSLLAGAFRRLRFMLLALLVPEFILSWAMGQWFEARTITSELQVEGWTMTHSYFLIMGGFKICRCGRETGILSSATIHKLSKAELRKIVEAVTVDEIEDKSKSDFISKSLTVFQSTWFIIQCMARGIQHLPMTELELLTVALASLNGLMYLFWWNKPLDVQTPILVHLGTKACPLRQSTVSTKGDVGDTDTLFESANTRQENRIDNRSEVSLINKLQLFDTSFSPRKAYTMYIFLGIIGSVFGGIHLIAWSFTFLDHNTWALWQISAIIITVCPLVFAASVCYFMIYDSVYLSYHAVWFMVLFWMLFALYPTARVILFGEALVLLVLKQFNPAVYADVNWAGFIPHFGR